MARLSSMLLLLGSVTSVASLFCYSCVFPAKAPIDCIHFPLKCPPHQLCLWSRAEGRRGDLRVLLLERGCVQSSLCDLRGQRFLMGLNFTFTNSCCDSDLCNTALSSGAPHWTGPRWTVPRWTVPRWTVSRWTVPCWTALVFTLALAFCLS